MTEMTRDEYRDRLSEGDTVYFVAESSGYNKPTGELAVLKGTVSDAAEGRRYPDIAIWRNRAEDPEGFGLHTTRSPRALFTESEVTEALLSAEILLHDSEAPVDELLDDPTVHAEAIIVLGSISMARLVDDEARRPGDPEY